MERQIWIGHQSSDYLTAKYQRTTKYFAQMCKPSSSFSSSSSTRVSLKWTGSTPLQESDSILEQKILKRLTAKPEITLKSICTSLRS